MSDRETRLAASLTALAPTSGGDWGDVIARSDAIGNLRRRRRRIAALVIAITMFVLGAGTTLAVGRQFFGFTDQPPKKGRSPLVVVVGRTVTGLPSGPAYLTEVPNNFLSGWSTPAAVLSPDANQIAYSAWTRKKKEPLVLRLFSTEGTDAIFAEGGYTPAWRSDGALAYARLIRPIDLTHRRVANVFVRTTVSKDASKWSRKPAVYMVYGWAKRKLLAYSEHECEVLEILVFDGPGKSRSLGYGDIVAIDPSGEMVAISPNACDDDRPSGSLRIVRLRDGRVLAQLEASKIAAAAGKLAPHVSAYVDFSGSWRGNEIAAFVNIAAVVRGVDVFRFGVAFFHYAHGRLSLEQMMRAPKRFTMWHEPVFLNRKGTRFAAIGELTDLTYGKTGAQLIICDRTTKVCKSGKKTKWRIAVVRNVSRPQPGW